MDIALTLSILMSIVILFLMFRSFLKFIDDETRSIFNKGYELGKQHGEEALALKMRTEHAKRQVKLLKEHGELVESFENSLKKKRKPKKNGRK